MIANCDYKHPGLCQNPILHDMDTSSMVSGYLDSDNTDMMSTEGFFARKNLAASNSATLKAYKNRDSTINALWGQNRVITLRKHNTDMMSYLLCIYQYLIVNLFF